MESVDSDEIDADSGRGDTVTPRRARLDTRPQVESNHSPTSRPIGFLKPKPKPRNNIWQSVLPAHCMSEVWFPTDIETAYLASVRLPHGTSLLVDAGS